MSSSAVRPIQSRTFTSAEDAEPISDMTASWSYRERIALDQRGTGKRWKLYSMDSAIEDRSHDTYVIDGEHRVQKFALLAVMFACVDRRRFGS